MNPNDFEMTPLTVATRGMTLMAYADHLALQVTFLEELGLTSIHAGGAAVRVPHLNADGAEIGARLLQSVDDERRNRWKSGSKKLPYGLNRLTIAHATGNLAIVSGEPACHILWHHGIPALGLAQPSVWLDQHVAPLLDGVEMIYLVVTSQSRAALVRHLSASSLSDRIRIVDLGDRDIVDLHRHDPAQFVAVWDSATAASVSLRDDDEVARVRRRDDAFAAASELLNDPRLLDRIAEQFQRMGYAGDPGPAILAYIGITSRVSERPMVIVFIAESGVGKSHTVDTALALFPDDAVHKMSASTPLALIYSDVSFTRKVIYYAEADSLPEDGVAAAAVRSLITDNRLVYETVGPDPVTGALTTRRIEKEGPTGFISTFTRKLSPQYDTRALQLRLDATPEQTQAVMAAHADRAMGSRRLDTDLAPFHALQTALELSDIHQAIVPFAGVLAQMLPSGAVRMRRDFRQLLTVIATITLLHQCQRERTADGTAVIAAIDDYRAARRLLAPHFARTTADGLTPAVRETVMVVQPGETLTISTIQERLGLKSSASAYERVRRAIRGGWLINKQTRRAQPAMITRGDPLPGADSVLPTAEQLAQRFGVSRQ